MIPDMPNPFQKDPQKKEELQVHHKLWLCNDQREDAETNYNDIYILLKCFSSLSHRNDSGNVNLKITFVKKMSQPGRGPFAGSL